MNTSKQPVAQAEADKPGFSIFRARTAWLFALGTLASGMLIAGISFAGAPAQPAYRFPDYWPPSWVFWAVWMVIYPCLGVAAWLVWCERFRADVRGALAVFSLTVLGAFFFLPISRFAQGQPAVLTMMDLNGLFTSWVTAWLFTRYAPKAIWWLLPLLVWMPITAGLKIALWLLN